MWKSMASAVLILLSITCQWFSRINAYQVLISNRSDSRLRPNAGATLKLKRDILDTIYDGSCTIAWRTTGSFTVCTCKPYYGTVMTKPGDKWDCNKPKEVGCAYSLDTISETNVHIISTNSTKVVPIFAGATDEDLSIKSISIWNRPSESQRGLWDEITDVAITYFTLHREADPTTTPQPTTTVTTAKPRTTMVSTKSATTKPKTTKSATTKPKTTKSATTKPKTKKLTTTKPKTTKLPTTKPTPKNSTTTESKTTKLPTTKPTPKNSTTTEPKTTKLPTTKPAPKNSTTTEPKTTKLPTTKPTPKNSTTIKPKSAATKPAIFYTNVVKSKTSLTYKIALDLWAGHVIKIQFGQGDKCALAKLKGPIHYPINITEFKEKIKPKPEPTTKPVPTSRPEPTTKPVPTEKTTKSTPTGRTPTTVSPKKEKQSSTVGIVIGVILGLILLIAVSTFVYRRRKSSSKGKSNDISIKNINHHDNPMAEKSP